jgi:uncharacterized protein YggE
MSTGVNELASFHLTVEVPKRLTNKAIEEAVLMAASRMNRSRCRDRVQAFR